MLRVQPVELARHLPQYLVDEGANGRQRMIPRDALLGGDVAKNIAAGSWSVPRMAAIVVGGGGSILSKCLFQ